MEAWALGRNSPLFIEETGAISEDTVRQALKMCLAKTLRSKESNTKLTTEIFFYQGWALK